MISISNVLLAVPNHTCAMYALFINQPGLGHSDPFVVSEVYDAHSDEAWQRSDTQDF